MKSAGPLHSLSGGREIEGRGEIDSSAATLAGCTNGGVVEDEGLSILRQQLSVVQHIRMEHERKDAIIATLRLEVSIKSVFPNRSVRRIWVDSREKARHFMMYLR